MDGSVRVGGVVVPGGFQISAPLNDDGTIGGDWVDFLPLTEERFDRYPDARRQLAEQMMFAHSVGAALQNAMLAAHAAGLASCWMCAPLFCPETVMACLGLDERLRPQALLTLGYAAEPPPPRMPSDAAPSRSPCSASRLRSRQVIWKIGSRPLCTRKCAAARLERCTLAPAPSVTLIAVASPLSGSARLRNSAGSVDTGGVISAVCDHVLGCVCYPVMKRGQWAATTEFKLNYLAPVKAGTLRAASQVVALTRTTAVVRVEVENDGRAVCVAQGTLLVQQPKPKDAGA